jgi:hypothetical protein
MPDPKQRPCSTGFPSGSFSYPPGEVSERHEVFCPEYICSVFLGSLISFLRSSESDEDEDELLDGPEAGIGHPLYLEVATGGEHEFLTLDRAEICMADYEGKADMEK